MAKDRLDGWPGPLPAEAVEQNLEDAGCSGDFVKEFLLCCRRGTATEQLRLLSRQRLLLLEQVHDSQRRLDCLDYLRDQIRRRGEIRLLGAEQCRPID